MSDERDHDDVTHDATTIRASKGGGGGKLLLGAVAAALLLGGGYAVWKNSKSGQRDNEYAINNAYESEPLRAGPLDSDDDPLAQSASTEDDPLTEDTVAPRSSTAARTERPARRSTARVETVPEATIGITPINATNEDLNPPIQDSDDIIVRAPPRPVWARTPSQRRLSALYPTRALERGREGEARLACIVQGSGALDCERVSSTPGGFGTAAMRVANTLRHAPTRADGADATGTPVNLRVVFRIDDEDQRFASR